MFPFFRKKESKAVSDPETTSGGFFSTHMELGSTKSQRLKALREQLAVTFQRGVDSIAPIGDDGKLITGQFAMDDAYNGMTQSRLVSNNYMGIPDAQLGWYAGQGFIGWQSCAILSQNWLIDKACTMPAKDATRNGYTVTANDGTTISAEVLDYIRQQDKKFQINRNCVEFVRMGRIFGIRIALFEVETADPVDYYAKPFNPDGVTPGSYKGISQIDPYWTAPLLDSVASANPAAKDFYEPTWWLINGRRIHRSHLVIMRTCELPDILKPSYIYGGIPIPQKIAERVYAAERTANEAPMLTMTKRLTTLNMDITQAVSDMDKMSQRMSAWTELRTNFGVQVVGEKEKIEQFDTSLADVDAVIMTQYQLVAAASNVPATKLMGTSPKGFNATGEFEEASYHEELESIQEHDLSPLVERHHLLLMRSQVAPKFGIAPVNTEINWNPVDSPTAAEVADINLKKAQADTAWSSIGAVGGEDVRNRLISDKDSGYNGLEAVDDISGEEEINASTSD